MRTQMKLRTVNFVNDDYNLIMSMLIPSDNDA